MKQYEMILFTIYIICSNCYCCQRVTRNTLIYIPLIKSCLSLDKS